MEIRSLLFIAVVVLISGCASTNDVQTSSGICDVNFDAYKDINAEVEGEGRTYIFKDNITVSGDIALPENLPEGINQSEILDKMNIDVVKSNSISMQGNKQKVCDAEVNKDDLTFSCTYEPAAGKYGHYLDKNLDKSLEGCASGGGIRGSSVSFYRLVEGTSYENSNFSVNISDIEVSQSQGWKELSYNSRFKNKGFDTEVAPEGVDVEYRIISSDGSVDRGSGHYEVLQSYSSERNVGGRVSVESPEYILMQLRLDSRTVDPKIAFKIPENP